MKKILSIILALSLLLGSFSLTSAFAATTYEKPSDFEEMTGLLKAIGIIDDNFAVSDRMITRAEFTKLIIKASGLSQYVSGYVANPSFSDVPSGNEYAPYIEFAKGKGLVLGYQDGTFKPEENITLTEAIVYLIRLLGYVEVAEANGGYPGGYQTLAYTINLAKGIKINLETYISAECAVNLLYNALNANVLMVDSFSKDSFEIAEGHPLLYENFKIIKEIGVVDGVDLTSLVGPNNVKPYHISVNGVLIDVGTLNPNDLLGYNVNAYYEKGEDVNTLKYIIANHKNDEVVLDIPAISNISDYTVYKNFSQGKQKIYKYQRGASIVYNGASTSAAFDMSMIKDSVGNKLQGNVKLLDNNDDGTFDVVFVNVYEEYIVGRIDVTNKTLYDYNSSAKNIKLDVTANDPYTVIYDENGEEINIAKIKADSTVVVFKSKEKPETHQEFIRAYVSEKKVTGRLTTVGYDNDDNRVVQIDGKDYKMTNYISDDFKERLLGSTVIAYINCFGEVTFVKADDGSSDKWGMLTAVRVTDYTDSPDQTYIFRILNDAGEFVDYVPAKYITLDGRETRIKTDDEAAMRTNSNSLIKTLERAAEAIWEYPGATEGQKVYYVRQMIKYRVNNDNKINYIDTVLSKNGIDKTTRLTMEPSDSIYCEVFPASGSTGLSTYTNGGIHIGSKYYATAATKVFLYHPTDKDMYGVVPATTAYQSYVEAKGIAFYGNEKSVFPDVYMKENDNDASMNTMYTNYFAIIKKLTDTVDEDGAAAKKVYAYVNNAPVSFICKGDKAPANDLKYKTKDSTGTVKDFTYTLEGGKAFELKDLKEGDIIAFSLDLISGQLSRYELVYRDGMVFGYSDAGQLVEMAHVLEVQNDGFLYVLDDVGDTHEEAISKIADKVNVNGDYSAARLTTAAFTVYDPAEADSEKIKAASLGDLFAYKDFMNSEPNSTTKILIHIYSSKYRRPVDIFVLK